MYVLFDSDQRRSLIVRATVSLKLTFSSIAVMSGLLVADGFCFVSSAWAQPYELKMVAASKTSLDNPHDLKLSPDGRWLFVSDVGNNRIAVLDPQTLELVTAFGEDHQSGTHDIDVNADGVAYVADTHNNRVTIYRMDGPEGELIGELNQKIRGPEGVLYHPDGRVYVAGAWSGNVVVFENGGVKAELTGLSSPHDLEFDLEGNIWLADAGNHRMLLLSPELEIIGELGQNEYDFNGVRYQDVLPDGTLVVADKYNHQVKFISPDGQLVYVHGNGRAGKGENQFTTPEGVEIRHSTLWISDSGNDRVIRFQLNRN
jgi:DNA-binding beta-propeller fold protein YncE